MGGAPNTGGIGSYDMGAGGNMMNVWPSGGSGGGFGGGFDWSSLLGGLGGLAGGIGQIFAGNSANAAGNAASSGMQQILNQMYGGLNGVQQNLGGISGQLQNFQLPPQLIQAMMNTQLNSGQSALRSFQSQAGGVPNMGNAAQSMMQNITQGGMQGTQQLGAEAAQDQLQALMGAGDIQLGMGGLDTQAAGIGLQPYEMAYSAAQQNAQNNANGWGNTLSGLGSLAGLFM
jgi:hypothetical protein